MDRAHDSLPATVEPIEGSKAAGCAQVVPGYCDGGGGRLRPGSVPGEDAFTVALSASSSPGLMYSARELAWICTSMKANAAPSPQTRANRTPKPSSPGERAAIAISKPKADAAVRIQRIRTSYRLVPAFGVRA